MTPKKILLILFCAITTTCQAAEKEFGDDVEEWQARLELARVMSYQKKYPEAIKQFYVVLSQKPNDTAIQAELAEVLAYAGRTDDSIKILNKLVPKTTDDSERLRYANVYSILKQFRPAQSLYLGYLEKHPDDPKARYRYAEMLTWEKRYADAVKQYEILLKDRANDIQLRRKYALVLIWMGDTERGKEELEKTLVSENQ